MLSKSVSSNLRVTFFEAPVTGYTLYWVEFKGGEIINCLLMSFSVMYSLNVRFISSLSKKIVFSLGEALISTGGMESLGPPVGDARFAHCTVDNKSPVKRIKFKASLIIQIIPTK